MARGTDIQLLDLVEFLDGGGNLRDAAGSHP
jgi:hypothetical protein